MPEFATTLLTSAGVVALAEVGDKTQLLAIVLATRFRAPIAVVAGILVATIANHAVAAWAGSALAGGFDGPLFRTLVALSFIVMAGWTLIPDTLATGPAEAPKYGAFLASAVAFFLVEIGDKTQVATIALGARFDDVLGVTLGTTLGMMVANVPAVFLGHKLIDRVPMRTVRVVAALAFLGVGLWLLAATWLAIGLGNR